jgi:eukaryotic-like serine/threonine-protein kinase
LNAVAGGAGNLVLVSGEPGIGKTTLCDSIAGECRTQGVQVAWGRAWEGPGAPVYWQWIQVLRSIGEVLGKENSQVGSDLDDISELIPELRSAARASSSKEDRAPHRWVGEDPEVQRFHLFDSVLKVLAVASKDRPWLLIFDDCHAADESSLLLLEFLAKQIRQLRVLLLITYREADLKLRSRNAELLASIGREGDRIMLRGFQESDVADFLEATTDLKKNPEIVHKLFNATEGNPFFLNEIAALLEARSPRSRQDAATLEDFDIPDRVGTAIRLRLELVSESTRRALGAAATVGREFDERLLAALLKIDRTQAAERLKEAATIGVISELRDQPGRHQFVHALFAEYLHENLPSAERRQFHEQIASVLRVEAADGSDSNLSQIAHHLLQALPAGDLEVALDYARRAAQRATKLLAYDEGSRLYQDALQAIESHGTTRTETHCDSIMDFAESQHRLGDFAGASTNFERAALIAREISSASCLARAYLGFGQFPETPGVVNQRLIRGLEQALDSLGQQENSSRALVLARLAEALQWSDPENRRASLAKDAVAIARHLGDPATLAEVLYRTHIATLGPDTPAEDRLASSTEILALARQCQNARLGLTASYLRIRDLLETGDISQLDREIQSYAQMTTELRQQHLGITEAALAMRALLDGRFEEAEQFATQAVNLGQNRRDGMATQAYATQISLIRREQNRFSELEPMIKGYAVQFPELIFARCALAFCYSEIARAEDAQFYFEQLAQNDFSRIRRDVSWLACMALLSETCVSLGDTRRAEILYGQLLPFASNHASLDMYVSYGPVALYLGMLATNLSKFEAAEEHFQDALSLTAQSGARPWHARAKYRYAQMLANRSNAGDREKAIDLAESALASAKSLAMSTLEQRVKELDPVLGSDKRSKAIARLLGQHGRTLATIMFLDIVDSTVHASAAGDASWTATLDSYYALIRSQLKQFDGVEINTFGDDYFALFKNSANAVRCASSICRQVRDFGIEIRAGLHTGECELREGKVSGIAVHIGARVVRFAGSGEVVVSSTVKDVTSGAGFDFDDRGSHELKGVPGTWRLFALRTAPL